MSRPEFIDECIDCGKKIHNSDCRFFLCPECREKEKRIPLWTEAYHKDKGISEMIDNTSIGYTVTLSERILRLTQILLDLHLMKERKS